MMVRPTGRRQSASGPALNALLIATLAAFGGCGDAGGAEAGVDEDAAVAADAAAGGVGVADAMAEDDAGPEGCSSDLECAAADPGQCAAATCDKVAGVCVVAPVADYTPCDDGDACTVDEVCVEGLCGGGLTASCDDDNPCTADACDAEQGCQSAPDDTLGCDDGDPCTSTACVGGACEVSPSGACGCAEDADCAAFDDEDLCNGQLVCLEDQCVVDAASVVVCDTSGDGACVKTTCTPATGACEALQLSNLPCSDGDPCTQGDTCMQGECTGTEIGCTCTVDFDCATFEDGDLCNGTLVCADGHCEVDTGSVVTCDDQAEEACKMVGCDPGTGVCTVSAVDDGSACDDGDACTAEDACVGGACVAEPKMCDDGNPCTDATCDPASGCVYTNHDQPCDDGDACTEDDLCVNGGCEGAVIECEDGDPCTADACKDGVGCVAAPLNCDDDDACTADGCEPELGCVHEALVCDDDDDCTADNCDAGEGCLNGPIVCDDGDVCTLDACDGGLCVYALDYANPACEPACVMAVDCDDVDACTVDACGEGLCAYEPVDCDDGDPCTNDTCDVVKGCIYVDAPSGVVHCDDGDPCTVDDLCNGGECVGKLDEACLLAPCCEPTGEPGCADPFVAECVCASMPGCCEVAWAPECAEAAISGCGQAPCPGGPVCGDHECAPGEEACSTCPIDCGPCSGDCCVGHAGPGCEDGGISDCVCEVDPFCCDTEWDDLCVDSALDCGADCSDGAVCGDAECSESEACTTCPEDCGACTASCCDPGDGPGCGDAGVQACVCDLDDFCCAEAWDELCVAEAEAYCELGCPP